VGGTCGAGDRERRPNGAGGTKAEKKDDGTWRVDIEKKGDDILGTETKQKHGGARVTGSESEKSIL
jgi:hypothetical protein